ncbi:MAG TPA: tetratricopeptide repeat protein [Verrucomicrobiae bacterium]|jgi:tetratricopeptide (TPR) repeat protein
MLAAADQDFQAQQYDAAELKYKGVLRLSLTNADAVRQLGLLYFAQGRVMPAGSLLERSLKQNPTNVEVQIKMAQAATVIGDRKYALFLDRKVLQKQPTNTEALLLFVDLARTPTNMAIARAEIEKLQANAPDAVGFHEALAWIAVHVSDVTTAEAEIKKALALDPKQPSTYVAEAALALIQKDRQTASADLKKASDLSSPRSDIRIKYANYQFETGSTNEGVAVLEDATRQAPDYIPNLIALMRMYYTEHELDKCGEMGVKILGRDPANLDALMQSADVYLDKRDGTNALNMYKRLESVPLYKENPVVGYHKAEAYLILGDKPNAITTLNALIASNRYNVQASLLLANLDLRGGNALSAINILLPLVQHGSVPREAYMLLATSYLIERKPEDALATYDRMEKVFPKDPEVERLVGMVYEQQKDLPHAREAFEKSLALAPDYLPSIEKITDLDVYSKHYDDAEKRLEALMTRAPKRGEPWMLEGQVFWQAGQTNKAEEAISKALELNPNLQGAYLLLARMYIDTHQTKEALARLNDLVSKTNNSMAWVEIGQIHQAEGEFDQARDAYEKLSESAPEYPLALNNLAFLYSEHYGNIEKAAGLAERARKLSPDSPSVADTLGWILYKQGQYSRALGLLQEGVTKEPNAPDLQLHLGMVYYMMEEENLARLHLQQAVSAPGDFSGKEEARQSLALLSVDPAKATPADIEMLEKRLHDNPHDPIPLNRLAAIYEQRGDMNKAVEAYQKLIAQNAQDWKAMIKLGRLYAGPLHDTRKALDLAKAAHELAPNDPRATAMLGELVYTTGDHSWALTLLEEAAPRMTNDPLVEYNLALAYYANGRLPKADGAMDLAVQGGASFPKLEQAKQFQAYRAAATDPSANAIPADQIKSVLDKDPHYLPALALLGIQAENRGDAAQATKTYEQILTDYPKFAPAMRQLALIYAKNSGDASKAYDLAEKAKATFPNDPELSRTLGILAYRKAEYQRSVTYLRQNAQKLDSDGELSYYLGMDYYNLKQTKESKQYLKKAVALNVPAPMVDDAKKVLAELK